MAAKKDIARIQKKIDRAIKKEFQAKQAKTYGQLAVKTIVDRTRKGKGLNGDKLQKLDRLSDSYIETRKRYRKNLSKTTSPRKSNLTATGQMLRSLTFRSKNRKIELFFKGRRRRELTGKGSGRRNVDVASFANLFRPFFGLTKRESNSIAKVLAKNVSTAIRRIK